MNLLIYACLHTWCSTHVVMLPAAPSVISCGMAQTRVASWSMANPGWQVRRWNCEAIGAEVASR